MYKENMPLIDQLSFIHLKECIKIANELKNKKKLIFLNNKSLKYRGIK